MATARPAGVRRTESTMENDVDWLLQKRDTPQPPIEKPVEKAAENNRPLSPPIPQIAHHEPTPPQSPVDAAAPAGHLAHDDVAPHEPTPAPPAAAKAPEPTAPKAAATPPTSSPAKPPPQSPRPTLGSKGSSNNDTNSPSRTVKKEDKGRRKSWISSISSKFSSDSPPQRSGSADATPKSAPSPQPSPNVEFGNPFNKAEQLTQKDMASLPKKKGEEPVRVVTPRRQSVLVAAGKETDLDSKPGFLSSAFRRLSSSGNADMGKQASKGAIVASRIMNIDQNRERVKISDFDQNKLRRVSFCVDVEIAGYAAQGDEEPSPGPIASPQPPVSGAQRRSSLSVPANKSSTSSAKYKEKGEGAALKNPEQASSEMDEKGETKIDAAYAKAQEQKDIKNAQDAKDAQEAQAAKDNTSEDANKTDGVSKSENGEKPTTRKKEKKKRSEEERKARKEKKRLHAEKNGLVPLEITVNSEDSDSTGVGTGTSTPKNGASPTTDPLRIYKRCCQLRETTVLSRIKEQVSKASGIVAEAPGTVASVDLSGLQMQLQDVITFGDWLAIVPVRKLIMDNCNLSDEGLRVVLSGLTGCKSQEQAKSNKKLPSRLSGKSGREQMGVIEKLSLKNNSSITNLGWKHIALFLHMSHSIKGVDLSGIAFPRPGDLSRTTTASSGGNSTVTNGTSKSNDVASLVIRAIKQRLGDKLEELILTGCDLTNSVVGDLVDCAMKIKICRLGLANNALDKESLQHVVRYVKSGVCEGLDLGNNNLHGNCHVISEAVDDQNPLFAVSFSDCNLDPDDLGAIMIPFQKLRNLKFIDLSQNHALFEGKTDAVKTFRKLLPKLKNLKRIHLAGCGMTPDQAIALAEILPDCPSMCHVSLLENRALLDCMNSRDGSAQEEACALFASLMTATRVSETIVAIEIEVPSAESSEVVKALASQVVAYSLRNMERSALDDFGLKSAGLPEKDAPGVLLDLVGHLEGYDESHNGDEPAPNDDYVIASSGIVKALGICLGTKDGTPRTQSRNNSPTASGTATPRQGALRAKPSKKPRDVSFELCEGARKIRARLKPALIKQDKEGNDYEFRRLYLLDQTLQRMIQRFEDEYPETKLPSMDLNTSPDKFDITSLDSSKADASLLSGSVDSTNSLDAIPPSAEPRVSTETDDDHAVRINSSTNLAAKAYTNEEGRMLRFGQGLRREVLRPTGTTDYVHGTSENDAPEPSHLAKLRKALEGIGGEEIRKRVEAEGGERVVRELGVSARELKQLEEEDLEGYKLFKEAQFASALNSGMSWEEAKRTIGDGGKAHGQGQVLSEVRNGTKG